MKKLLVVIATFGILFGGTAVLTTNKVLAEGQFRCEVQAGVCMATQNNVSGCDTGYLVNQSYCNTWSSNLTQCGLSAPHDCVTDPSYGGNNEPCRGTSDVQCDPGYTCGGDNFCHVTTAPSPVPGEPGGACRTFLFDVPCNNDSVCTNNICVSCPGAKGGNGVCGGVTPPGGGVTPPGGGSGLNSINGLCGDGFVDTAIGCIPIGNQNSLIGFFLRWGMGIGGGIAFLLILVAGFQIMTSRGDPNRLKAGQELMTSAIAGLLLLIFSLVILRIIGVDILNIPGFAK
jgi:hypothetical protein